MTKKKDDTKSKKKAEKPKSKKKEIPTIGIPSVFTGPCDVKLSQIQPNEFNCNMMDNELYSALLCDMKGVDYKEMDPIKVRPLTDIKTPRSGTFEIIDGEHRFRAAKTLGWKTIRVYIYDIDNTDAMLWNFRINRQRGTHDPAKEASFFKHLQEDLGLTQQKIGKMLNVDRSVVSRRISILNIDKDILECVDLKETPVSVLEVIAQMPTKEDQDQLMENYTQYGSSVEDLQDAVNEKKEELAKDKRFEETLKKAKFPDCPKCGDKATAFWYTEPYMTDGGGAGHIWNPETGLSKQKEDAKQRAVESGHPQQARVLSVFRHQMAPSEIIAGARKNFADFAELVYNDLSEIKLTYDIVSKDNDYEEDVSATLMQGRWGNPEIYIQADQGDLRVVLEPKAYGSGEKTKVIVSEPSPYSEGGLEQAEKLLSMLIEGKLTFKKLAKKGAKQKLKLKTPKVPTMVQPTEKEIWELEAREVYKALARFCNHGKHGGKTDFPQEALLCGGYNCDNCLVRSTLEEAGLWGTKAMGGGPTSKVGEYGYLEVSDEGLPIASKLKLIEDFRKLLASGFKTEISTGGSMPVKAGGKRYLIAISELDKKLEGDTTPCPKCGDSKKQKLCGAGYSFCPACNLHHRPDDWEKRYGASVLAEAGLMAKDMRTTGLSQDGLKDEKAAGRIKGDPSSFAKKIKKGFDDAVESLNKPITAEERNIGNALVKKDAKAMAKKSKNNEDVAFRKADGLRKCLAYEDKKYCNGCVNTDKMKNRECFADPQGISKLKEKVFGKKPAVKKKAAKKRTVRKKPNENNVYEEVDEVLTYTTPNGKSDASIELVDTGKGWAMGYHYGHSTGSLARHGSPCVLDKPPFKSKAAAIEKALLYTIEAQNDVLKSQSSVTSQAQVAGAKKLIDWARYTYMKEVDPSRYICFCGARFEIDAIVGNCPECDHKKVLPRYKPPRNMKGVQ